MFIMFLIIAGVVATTFLFVFWVVINILRGVGRLVFGPPPGRSRPLPRMIQQPPGMAPMRLCDRVSCRAHNPVEASFCRRCGNKFAAPHQVPVRRAAAF
jgi:hypothetical protein